MSLAPVVLSQSGGTTFYGNSRSGTFPATALSFRQPTTTAARLSHQQFTLTTTSMPPQSMPAGGINDVAHILTAT